MKRLVMAACVALCFLAASVSAVAGNDRRQHAERLFASGSSAYREGDFAAALAAFQESFDLAARASTALNMAQCFRQLGQGQEAVRYYRLYLALWQEQHPHGDAPYRKDVERYIADLSEGVKKPELAVAPLPEDAKGAETKPVESVDAHDPGSGVKGTAALDAHHEASLTGLVPLEEPIGVREQHVSTSPHFYRRWWFWTAVGVVVAGATATTLALTLGHGGGQFSGNLAPGTVTLP